MKKIVTVLLVLIMALSVFTACGNDKSALEKAGEYLYAMYKDDDKSVTPNDFEVVGVVSVDGVKYTVEWTTDNDKIKLVPNETTKMVKVDVDERSETEENYTLTATIKDEKGKTYTVKFEHTVPQFVVSTVAQVKEMADGTDVVLSGVVVKIDTAWSDSYKNISVTLKDAAGNTILLYRLATKVELGDTLIVTGKVGSYNNAKQIAAGATAVIEVDHSAVGCTYPATGLTAVCTVCGKVNPAHTTCVDSDSNNICEECGKELVVTVLTIPQVLASEDGTDVVVKGVVVEIKEAWSSYNNMSYYIKDTEGNRLYIFRSTTQINLGDTVTITGKVGSYNNAKQIASGATATIDAAHTTCTYPATGLTAVCTVCGKVNPAHTTCVDSDSNNKCDQCGKELTVTVLTIPQVLASEDGTAVVVQGVVCEIVEAWSSYNNMSYYIKDANDNKLYIYRSKTQVEIGDTVTVTGAVGSYNNAKQIALGSTAVIDVDHSAAGCSYPTTGLTAICTVCGQVNPEHTSCTDSDSNGKCDACGAAVVSSNQTLLNYSVEAAATAGSWTNGTKPYSNNVFALDSNITMTLTATDSNTGKYYSSGYQIRIYQTGSPEITIAAATGYTIKSVKVSYGINNTGVLTHTSGNIDSGAEVTVNASSVTFGVGNTGTATNGQVRITAIEIVYEAVN